MELTIKNKTCLLTAFFDRGFIFVHKFAHQTQFMECKDSFITVFIEVFRTIIPVVLKDQSSSSEFLMGRKASRQITVQSESILGQRTFRKSRLEDNSR